jgi:hypothetical protein
MPLLQYFGWVGSVLLAALFAANAWCSGNVADAPAGAPPSERVQIRIRSDHKWPERVVFDTNAGSAPAESAQAQTGPQDQEARQKPVAVERQDPIEAFAEMPETLEGCLQPPCSADQNRASGASPGRKTALLRSNPAASRAARGLTAPNPFHRLPGKS